MRFRPTRYLRKRRSFKIEKRKVKNHYFPMLSYIGFCDSWGWCSSMPGSKRKLGVDEHGTLWRLRLYPKKHPKAFTGWDPERNRLVCISNKLDRIHSRACSHEVGWRKFTYGK